MYPADNDNIIESLVRDMSKLEIEFVGNDFKKREAIKNCMSPFSAKMNPGSQMKFEVDFINGMAAVLKPSRLGDSQDFRK